MVCSVEAVKVLSRQSKVAEMNVKETVGASEYTILP